MFERLVQPLISGIYAGDPECLSVEATMPRFRAMEREHGSLIRAALRQRRAAPSGNGGGARYGQFATLRGGVSNLVRALAERLPPETVHLGSPVASLTPRDGGRWLLSIGGQTPRRLTCDGVIVASPSYRAAKLLAEDDPPAATLLARIEYASSAVVTLGYRRDQIGHPLNGFGFVVPLVERRNILSCSFSSVKYAGRAPDGCVLLRVFLGGTCHNGLLRLTGDELVELAGREVGQLLEVRGDPILRDIAHHYRSMPQYHVGHRGCVQAIDWRLARFPTLALAGSAYSGVGIPACIHSAQAAAERIVSRLSAMRTFAKVGRDQAEAVV
jgi:oxygen-dependent protoporphyrinogen oxidase